MPYRLLSNTGKRCVLGIKEPLSIDDKKTAALGRQAQSALPTDSCGEGFTVAEDPEEDTSSPQEYAVIDHCVQSIGCRWFWELGERQVACALHMARDVMRTALDVVGDVMRTALNDNRLRDLDRSRNYEGTVLRPWLGRGYSAWLVITCAQFLTWSLRSNWVEQRGINDNNRYPGVLFLMTVAQDNMEMVAQDNMETVVRDIYQMASGGAGDQRDTARLCVEDVTLDASRNHEEHLATSGRTATIERSHRSVGGVTPEPCGKHGGAATTTGAAPTADRRRRGHRVIPLLAWEEPYNHRSVDDTHVEFILKAMLDAYSKPNHTYEKRVVKLAAIREPCTEGKKAVRITPDQFNEDNPNEQWYYAVSGQHNMKAALLLREHDIWNKHSFLEWPFKPLYFSDEDFDGYTQISVIDNMKDKVAPPRAQLLSMIDMRQIWKNLKRPRPMAGNVKFKQALVANYEKFQKMTLRKTPYHNLWQIVDSSTKEDKKVWQEKLRYFLPLVMSDDQTWQLGMKFYEEWTKGQLLAPEGALWTKRPPTTDPKATQEGQSFGEDSSGQKRVVYNVRVIDPELRKGKKRRKQEERDFFVQVNEPDVHCWKEMGDLTNMEKQRILRGVLDLEIVWVQHGSKKLVEHGKMGMKDTCEIGKQDRMLLRQWHIIEFQHQGRTSDEWNAGFFQTREQLLTQYGSRGLNEKLWAVCRRFVTDHSYLKDCPQYLGCASDKELKTTLSLVEDEKFPTEFKRVVLSVLKGERGKEKEAPVRLDDCTNIKWRDTKVVTTLAPFAFDAFTTFFVKDDMRHVVRQLRCHTCIIHLCDPVDRARWNEEAFKALAGFLETLCPEFWTVVAFVPRVWDLSFMSLLHCLPVVSRSARKWVRRGQIRKTYQIGNSKWAEEDRMYVLFHGDDLKLNTHPVYEEGLRDDDAAALGKKQKCTPSDIAETQFTPTTFHSADVLHQKGVVYKEMERNPSMLSNLMEFFCSPENAVMFLGKAHAQVVWNLLKSGRHVVAVEGDTELLSFLKTYFMYEINSGVHNCDLHIGQTSIQHDPNRNFWFKLSSEKRAKLYKFLFQDTRPSYRTDDDYRLCRQVAIGTLDGYHGGSREAATNFVDKLEECYFDQGKTEVTLNIFRAHVNDEEDFNPNDDEEVSVGNTEFELEATYRKHVGGVASSSTPATSQIPVGSPLGTPVAAPVATPTSGSSKGFLSSRRRPLSPTVRPELPILLPVLSGLLPGKIYHFGKDHRSTNEAEWGHHIVWHPDYFQPAVLDGEWVMSKVNDDGVWEVNTRMSKEDFLQVAHEEVLRGGSVLRTTSQEDKDVIDETLEMQATSPRDVRCDGTDDDFLSQLYSGIDTKPLSVDNFVRGDSTQALDMRPSQLRVVILVSGPCVEENDVTMSEQEEGVFRHPLGDDIARKLFHDDEDLAATAVVVDSSPGKTAGAGTTLVELSLDEDVEQQPADSLSPFVEEVVRIVDAGLDDLSKFPARLDLVVASGKIKGAGVVLGLKASCVQEEVPRVQDEHEDDAGGHAREEVVTGKQ
ncbi:hypothetical protein CBR_g41754 [Chara braunii]|uniref:Uncharacterized protein n=1 Tax=Chara braunii TaxID=69332 RepID=A0A388LWP4_CHABU|nr:hypothetical protein CBR_g41754 [Chara braunii]|eukprot:GBG86691.1 hypothetical protein CBR_g41754 [Chara braunii]